jgi:phospholipase D1/2
MNFEQRWKKSTKWRDFALLAKKMAQWQDDALIKIERISWIISPTIPVPKQGDYTIVPEDDPILHVTKEDDPDNWHVQVTKGCSTKSFLYCNLKEVSRSHESLSLCRFFGPLILDH